MDRYVSPELAKYDKKNYDTNGLWTIYALHVDVIEYNTQAISKEQAPKSYQDLLKPEFKGKLGLEASAIVWFTYMLRIMGQDKGLDYMNKLAEQKPRLISGHTALHKLVVSGEIPVAVYMYDVRPLEDKAKGAPVEWVDPVETTPTAASFIGIVKNAPHPNAGRLMEDFLLSEEGAQLLVKQQWFPTRQGVELGNLAPLSKVDMMTASDPSVGQEVTKNDKTFRDIFGKP